MDKKVYFAPQVKVVQIEASAILAGSTGATGEDIPWAARENNISFDDEFDYEED